MMSLLFTLLNNVEALKHLRTLKLKENVRVNLNLKSNIKSPNPKDFEFDFHDRPYTD